MIQDAVHRLFRAGYAAAALDLYRPLDPEVLAEIVRRADALERDPSTGIRWEDLREELERKDT